MSLTGVHCGNAAQSCCGDQIRSLLWALREVQWQDWSDRPSTWARAQGIWGTEEFVCTEILREIWQEFCGFSSDPQNKGPNMSGNFGSNFRRNFVAQKSNFVSTLFCRSGALTILTLVALNRAIRIVRFQGHTKDAIRMAILTRFFAILLCRLIYLLLAAEFLAISGPRLWELCD